MELIIEKKNAVALVTLNRPKALNALNDATMRDLAEAFTGFAADKEVRVIIITGSEKAFAAGADIKEMAEKKWADTYNDDFVTPFHDAIANCRKPVIAAVSGYALGGGCELALLCDFIVAGDNAKFGQPEVTIGTLPGIGGSQRLTRAVGKAKAMEMCLTGRMIDAAEAERIGMVARVFPAAELLAETLKIAGQIASYSQTAVMLVKESVNRAFETTLAEGLRFERRLFQASFGTEDQKEGMAAFVEKRKAVFKDR